MVSDLRNRFIAAVSSMCLVGAILSGIVGCVPLPSAEEAHNQLLHETGFQMLPMAPGEPAFLEKNHRGYRVLFRPQMGNVWGRWAGRVAMGEVGRELGRVGQFLTGSYPSGIGGVTGSPLDRVLSRIIGQPLTFYFVLAHGKKNAPRLDIVSDFSTVTPDDPQPRQARVSFTAGSIYSSDRAFVERLLNHPRVLQRVAGYRSQYIRVDDDAVSFIFAGSETDWSAEIREEGGYGALINSVVDSLADIADEIDRS